MINTNEFLEMVTPPLPQSDFTLGTVKSNKIQFDGEETPSQKEYKILNNIALAENDRVLLASVSGTFVVLGKI